MKMVVTVLDAGQVYALSISAGGHQSTLSVKPVLRTVQ